MVRGLLSGELEFTQELAERLDKCTLCATCMVNCPAKTNIPNVVVAARADTVRARGLTFPYNIVYRSLLPRRKLFGSVVRFASRFQGIFLPKTQGKIRHLPFFLSALGKGRQIPEIAPKFLREEIPVVNKPPDGVRTIMTVGYFTGCMTDFVFPDVGQRIVTFLSQNGVEVIVPREQGCCGAPVFLGAGDFSTGRKFADSNAKAFEDVDYVITDCASCGSAMRDYRKFLADNPQREEAYTTLGKNVKDITEFLVDVLKLPPEAYKVSPEFKGKKVTWHDPCHLNRHMGVKEQPRKILRSLHDISYIEMPNADRCCGMAGSFSLHFYELSKDIAEKKMSGIESTGADIVVTDCPGCEIQLLDSATQQKKPVRIMHIMELFE